MKLLIAVSLMFVGFASFGQYSIGGGASTLFQFGNNKPFGGLHIVAEFPRNNEVTFYVRANYLFKQNLSQSVRDLYEEQQNASYPDLYIVGKDPSVTPQSKIIPYNFKQSFNYFMIDGGTRYYIINGYDEGFALYGGTNIGVAINSVKFRYQLDDYDTSRYKLEYDVKDDYYNYGSKGTVLNLAVGISGGLKYTFPGRGTFYFDFNPALMVFALPSQPDIETTLHKNVIFNFNIGYRREFY